MTTPNDPATTPKGSDKTNPGGPIIDPGHNTSLPPPSPSPPCTDGTVPPPKPTNGDDHPNDVPKNGATTPPSPTPTKGNNDAVVPPSPLPTDPKNPAPAKDGSKGTDPKDSTPGDDHKGTDPTKA